MTYFSALCRKLPLTLAFAAAVAFPNLAHAADYTQVRQPGWDAMCLRQDQPINFCGSFPGRQQLRYSNELAALLSQINSDINSRYRYRSDSGGNDVWSVPTDGTADCEDYVLAKMLQLHNSGIGLSAAVLMIEHLPNGRWHVRLGVRTDAGTVVLDSLQRDISIISGIGRANYYLNMSDTSSWRVAR